MFLYSGNWYIPVNCRIEITIRIRCLRAIFKRPTREQARKLCDMVKAGIKKHWEVDILDNQGNFKNVSNHSAAEQVFRINHDL